MSLAERPVELAEIEFDAEVPLHNPLDFFNQSEPLNQTAYFDEELSDYPDTDDECTRNVGMHTTYD